jgi:hypothetical protein
MKITLPISDSKSRIEPIDFSVFSGEEEAQLIVRLTGDCDPLPRDILKAAPLEVVLVKLTF